MKIAEALIKHRSVTVSRLPFLNSGREGSKRGSVRLAGNPGTSMEGELATIRPAVLLSELF